MSFINSPPNSNLILQNNHPIIERKDNYLLDRKLLTIHSEDRDYSKWPDASEFEIQCPQSYTNIQSMRLTEINFPCNYYNFSNTLQNTKFRINIISSPPFSPPLAETNWTIDISDGYYTNTQLASTITYQLNNTIPQVAPGSIWKAVYHEVKEKILIGNNGDINFELDNTIDFSYNTICGYDKFGNPIEGPPPTVNYFERYNKFSLLSYIGYTKKIKYSSQQSNNTLVLQYEDPSQVWLPLLPSHDIYWIEPPKVIDILGEMVMYMELEYFNSYDELIPWPDTSGNSHCFPLNAHSANDVKNCPRNTNSKWRGNGSRPPYPPGYPPGPAEPKYVAYRGSGIKSSFAKIPMITIPKAQIFSSTNGFLFNITQYTPPVERISKFKFKFRYHDGRLVDFQENDFNFSLEINQLRNEIKRDLHIRQPQFVQLS